MARPLIIDCDPGTDDAVALLLAFASPEFDLLGVTTVAGNLPLTVTSTNALKICEVAGRVQTPVYAGCGQPLLRQLVTAAHVHGDTGLGGADLPAPDKQVEDQHAVDFIVETLLASDGDVTLAALGPLTNIATAMARAPEIVPKIWQIVLMGGSIGKGNVTPDAEFNMHVDPHAAAVVFSARAPVVMIGLDVTHQALATETHIAAFEALGNNAGLAVARLLRPIDGRPLEHDGVPLHDPCVMAYLLRPDLFTGRPAQVTVVAQRVPEAGRTDVVFAPTDDPGFNATVLETIDADGFFELLLARVATLP